ncbi:hypothetical protein B0T14DRAFT_231026 [Immersiella caudata]|uniref:Uncharacterized protein n=1 Tax=Immersiella caudata TaxID=314043 RepID=A0AA39WRS4_9PEZI|nr:hypothetical protein B0T14DRAFT_231026 [Immersiella caudata]
MYPTLASQVSVARGPDWPCLRWNETGMEGRAETRGRQREAETEPREWLEVLQAASWTLTIGTRAHLHCSAVSTDCLPACRTPDGCRGTACQAASTGPVSVPAGQRGCGVLIGPQQLRADGWGTPQGACQFGWGAVVHPSTVPASAVERQETAQMQRGEEKGSRERRPVVALQVHCARACG